MDINKARKLAGLSTKENVQSKEYCSEAIKINISILAQNIKQQIDILANMNTEESQRLLADLADFMSSYVDNDPEDYQGRN